jgi:hypothetical protein
MANQRDPRGIKANPIPLGFRGKGVQNEEQIGNQNAVVGVKQAIGVGDKGCGHSVGSQKFAPGAISQTGEEEARAEDHPR